MDLEELQNKLLEAAHQNDIKSLEILFDLHIKYNINDLIQYVILDDETTSDTLEYIFNKLGDDKPNEEVIIDILTGGLLEDLIMEGSFTDQLKFNIIFAQYKKSKKVKEAIKYLMNLVSK